MSIARLKTLINIAKNEHKLDDETYRAKLVAITNKSSLRDMNQRELNDVLASFKDAGFKVKHKAGAASPSVSTNSKGKPKTPEIAKIRAIWVVMFEQGFIEDGSENALNAYVQRMTVKKNGGAGVQNVGWLSSYYAERVLESLKKWHVRVIKLALTERRVPLPKMRNDEPFKHYEPFAVLYARIHSYDKWVSEIPSDRNLKDFHCPRCGFKMKTPAPLDSDCAMWESACSCPSCESFIKKWITARNVVTKVIIKGRP